jgi:hypothetical protein
MDFQQELVRTRSVKNMDLKDVFILDKIICDVLLLYERVLLYINSFEVFMLYILMYPILNSTRVLDFLDTSSMGVTCPFENKNGLKFIVPSIIYVPSE